MDAISNDQAVSGLLARVNLRNKAYNSLSFDHGHSQKGVTLVTIFICLKFE